MSITILVDHRRSLGPIRDQGARPTCLSFACTSAHEHARGSKMPLSPEYLHYFASARNSTDGASFPELARALQMPGQPLEKDCPYFLDGLPLGWLPPSGVKLYRRQSDLKQPSADDVESLLIGGHVPVLGISITDSFFSPAPAWLIPPDGPIRGYHAVVAAGLGTTDASRYFLVRNSWGVEWGEDGYAWLDETFLALHLRDLLTLTEEVT